MRINGIDTHYMYRDVVDVIEQAGQFVDTVLIPKVGVPSDVYMVDAMLTQIEDAKKLPQKIGIEVLIETALGMANVEAIAQSSKRLEAMHFGVADYAASVRARTTNIGGLNPDYPGDQWHFGISRMVVACRAYGLRAIDGPFGDFKDPDGFKLAARRAAALGCEGKWAIHPTQIELANEIFTPSAGGGDEGEANSRGARGGGGTGARRRVSRRAAHRCGLGTDGAEHRRDGGRDREEESGMSTPAARCATGAGRLHLSTLPG